MKRSVPRRTIPIVLAVTVLLQLGPVLGRAAASAQPVTPLELNVVMVRLDDILVRVGFEITNHSGTSITYAGYSVSAFDERNVLIGADGFGILPTIPAESTVYYEDGTTIPVGRVVSVTARITSIGSALRSNNGPLVRIESYEFKDDTACWDAYITSSGRFVAAGCYQGPAAFMVLEVLREDSLILIGQATFVFRDEAGAVVDIRSGPISLTDTGAQPVGTRIEAKTLIPILPSAWASVDVYYLGM